MNSILAITAPVFLIITIGYIFAHLKILKEKSQQVLSLYVLYCSMPAYLFLAMAKVPHGMLINIRYMASFALSMVGIAFLGGLITRKIYKRDGASTILAMMGACYTNSAFVGIPIIVMTYGQIAPVVVITLFQVIVGTTTILTGIEIYQKHGSLSLKALLEFPKTVLLNPIVGASFLGILFSFQEWSIPETLEKGFQMLGNAGIPTGLFALGLSLGEKHQPLPSRSRYLVYSLVVLKTVLHPDLAWVVGNYIFHLGDPWLGTVTIVAALPTALNNFVFAQRYDAFVAESGQVVFFTSVVSLLTLSGLLWLLGLG